MKIIVTLKAILPLQTIQSNDGSKTYTKREFIATEKDSKYPKDICFTLFGEDKVKMLDGFIAGNIIEVMFDIQSREYNERWYTSVDAWMIKPANEQTEATKKEAINTKATITPPKADNAKVEEQKPTQEGSTDDLPF
ncbi:MAG: DUF3127 domain-containing protein [Paludibacteraceae bacterium]|nr:DUF3127 domain-containing protein [Paludibacteraceae bacterium]MBQ6963515.1 DUF3127 domain-containing protein [Paludibacteraceae bacterium]MBQ7662472.1 DUF3127 domain-containing protein [Prevotella sp.]MBQ7748305.1 DUF3127 domain-containing protein [Paludibacteraceae bacterium]